MSFCNPACNCITPYKPKISNQGVEGLRSGMHGKTSRPILRQTIGLIWP